MSDRFNDEQREAIERRGRVFVSAGAGTGSATGTYFGTATVARTR